MPEEVRIKKIRRRLSGEGRRHNCLGGARHRSFKKFRESGIFGRMDLEPRSWMANRIHHSKMNILHFVDRSVAILDGPWRKSFEKYAKRCDVRDF